MKAGLVAMLVLMLGLGCAPDPPCGLKVCDIRQPDCQRAVASGTACLRGQAPADVPIRVVPLQQYLAESVAAGEGNVDPVLFGRWMAGLSLFGLASADVTVAEASRDNAAWVAAFYDPGDKSITIIDRGRPLSSRGAVTLLVHEYTHALQDRHVGLQVFRDRLADDFDRLLAYKAVTEGEATLVEDLAAVGLFGQPEAEVPWSNVFTRFQQRARDAAFEAKLPLDQSIGYFPYPFGLPYVFGAYRAGGFARVDRLYVEPPTSSAEVLEGFAPSAAAVPGAEELAGDSVPLLPARFSLVDGDRLGGWMLEVFVERLLGQAGGSAAAAQARADLKNVGRALRADWLSILKDGDTDRTLACWRLRLGSSLAADTLARHLRNRGSWSVWSRERDVILLASGDADVRQLGTSDLAFGPRPQPAAMPSGSASPRRTLGCPER